MGLRIRLKFPEELIQEPVVFTMATKFNVVPNIRRARVTETVGEMILELEGNQGYRLPPGAGRGGEPDRG
jgi:ABC-type methionine transport system ATPase subunit